MNITSVHRAHTHGGLNSGSLSLLTKNEQPLYIPYFLGKYISLICISDVVVLCKVMLMTIHIESRSACDHILVDRRVYLPDTTKHYITLNGWAHTTKPVA